MTIGGLGAEGATVNTLLRTAHSQSVVSFGAGDMREVTRSFRALPEAQLAPGDLQILSALSGPVVTTDIRSAALYFRSPLEQTLTLGPPITQPTFSTVAATPTLRLRAQFVAQTAYDQLTSVSFQQGQTTVVSVGMTASYVALTGAGYALVIPDLSAVAGFDQTRALRAGVGVSWTAVRTGGTLGLGNNAVPTDGATTRNAIVSGTLPD